MEQMVCARRYNVSLFSIILVIFVANDLTVLSDEIETTMRLMGVTSLDQLNDFYVNARQLENDLPLVISKL